MPSQLNLVRLRPFWMDSTNATTCFETICFVHHLKERNRYYKCRELWLYFNKIYRNTICTYIPFNTVVW